MADISINKVILAKKIDNNVKHIYPKTDSELVEYSSEQNVKQKINSIDANIQKKINSPTGGSNTKGQVLETNGDGTTSWVTRPRIYVGTGDMPDGYDIKIDPNSTSIKIDKTLSIDGAIAEALSTGKAIDAVKSKITSDISQHDSNNASHIDIRNTITEPKNHIVLKDISTGDEYQLYMEDGALICDSVVLKPASLIISTAPSKTSYKAGEVFNPAGMVVTVKYNDNSTKTITDYIYPTTPLIAGTTSINITYIEAGITVTATVSITVS